MFNSILHDKFKYTRKSETRVSKISLGLNLKVFEQI